jgi:hypothetical protein
MATSCGGSDFTGFTSLAWGDSSRCDTLGPTTSSSQGACGAALVWDGSRTIRRCCCSDTHQGK